MLSINNEEKKELTKDIFNAANSLGLYIKEIIRYNEKSDKTEECSEKEIVNISYLIHKKNYDINKDLEDIKYISDTLLGLNHFMFKPKGAMVIQDIAVEDANGKIENYLKNENINYSLTIEPKEVRGIAIFLVKHYRENKINKLNDNIKALSIFGKHVSDGHLMNIMIGDLLNGDCVRKSFINNYMKKINIKEFLDYDMGLNPLISEISLCNNKNEILSVLLECQKDKILNYDYVRLRVLEELNAANIDSKKYDILLGEDKRLFTLNKVGDVLEIKLTTEQINFNRHESCKSFDDVYNKITDILEAIRDSGKDLFLYNKIPYSKVKKKIRSKREMSCKMHCLKEVNVNYVEEVIEKYLKKSKSKEFDLPISNGMLPAGTSIIMFLNENMKELISKEFQVGLLNANIDLKLDSNEVVKRRKL